MFDSVLGKGNVPRGRFGAGTVVSVIVHIALLSCALWMSMRPPPEEELDTEVTFFAAPPPPPPPPPPPAAPQPKTEVKKRPVKKPDTIVTAKDPTPPEQPPRSEPEPEQVEGGVVGGVEGGVVGGVLGGALGGQLGGQLGGEVIPFGEGMTRPELISGPEKPEYTREALEARVEGMLIARCTITTSGRLENCRIIKSLPHLEEAVLSMLRKRRYKPVSFQGRPANVDYVFNIKFMLPNR